MAELFRRVLLYSAALICAELTLFGASSPESHRRRKQSTTSKPSPARHNHHRPSTSPYPAITFLSSLSRSGFNMNLTVPSRPRSLARCLTPPTCAVAPPPPALVTFAAVAAVLALPPVVFVPGLLVSCGLVFFELRALAAAPRSAPFGVPFCIPC